MQRRPWVAVFDAATMPFRSYAKQPPDPAREIAHMWDACRVISVSHLCGRAYGRSRPALSRSDETVATKVTEETSACVPVPKHPYRTRTRTLSASRLYKAYIGSTSANPAAPSLLQFDGKITTSGFSLAASRSLGPGQVRLGIVSPLRVDRARLAGTLSTGFDVVTGAIVASGFSRCMAAQAREKNLELSYALDLRGGRIELAGAHSFDVVDVDGRNGTAAGIRLVIAR